MRDGSRAHPSTKSRDPRERMNGSVSHDDAGGGGDGRAEQASTRDRPAQL